MGRTTSIMNNIYSKASSDPKSIVYPEGEQAKIIKAAQIAVDQGIAKPILLGDKANIEKLAKENHCDLHGISIINPLQNERLEEYIEEFHKLRQRKGVNKPEAVKRIKNRYNYFGAMMVAMGDADGMISGMTSNYPDTIRPALEVIGTETGVSKAAGLYIVNAHKKTYFLADTTVNIDPTAEDIADIALKTADFAHNFDIEPRVALLSYSNFGSAPGKSPQKMREALKIVRSKSPDLMIDGEMQANTAVAEDIINEDYCLILKDSSLRSE